MSPSFFAHCAALLTVSCYCAAYCWQRPREVFVCARGRERQHVTGSNASIDYPARLTTIAARMLNLQHGSNSLRGGKKKYGPKTKCGNWVELNKEPGQTLPSGFPHAMFKTDAHQQMLEGIMKRPRRFGAGLPPPKDARIDYSRVINYDKQQADSGWAGITATEFVAPYGDSERSKEFASTFKLTGGLTDPNELRKYRRAWTVENDCVRPVRFKTDAVISSNSGVPPRFRMTQIRSLPGTPKAVDRLCAKILEAGQMGVVRLRRALQQRVAVGTAAADGAAGGGGSWSQRLVQPSDLREGLKNAGMTPLSALDAQKVIDFFTAGDSGDGSSVIGGATVSRIVEGLQLVPMMSENRRRATAAAFRELDEDGTGVIRAKTLQKRYDAAARAATAVRDTGWGPDGDAAATGACPRFPAPEARQTLLDAAGDGLTRAVFEEFVSDASHGVQSDEEFAAMLKALLGNERHL